MGLSVDDASILFAASTFSLRPRRGTGAPAQSWEIVVLQAAPRAPPKATTETHVLYWRC